VKDYRFKSGISLNQTDFQSIMISIGSDIVLELSDLTTNQIKWILAMVPLSTYHDHKLIDLRTISPGFKRLLLKTFRSLRLLEPYDPSYPDYLESENVNNVARISTEFLGRDWHQVLKSRRSKTIALIGVSRFNIELIELLIEMGFRKFQVQDDLVGATSVGITFESGLIGQRSIDQGSIRHGLVDSLIQRFRHIKPKVEIRADSRKLPDLLIVSETNSLEHVRTELPQNSGVANLFCLIEPLNAWISPVLPNGELCCYRKLWESLPGRTRVALSKNSRVFGKESYHFGDARQLKLLVALASYRIANFLDGTKVDSDTQVWKIAANGEYESVSGLKNSDQCQSCQKPAKLKALELTEIENF
jgi:hypothetical protein